MTDASFAEHRPPKRWLRISLTVAGEMTDAVSDFLYVLTGSGVEIAAAAEPDKSEPRERITGYLLFEENREGLDGKRAELQVFLAKLAESFPECPVPIADYEEIEEEDWGRNWKKHFSVIRVTPRIVIKPTWEKYDADKTGQEHGEVVIEIDPGLAFGTGHHASTSLALNLIDEVFTSRVGDVGKALDIGTGTGILAMGCALLGGKTVLAVDNDPDAVAAAQENVRHNSLDEIVTVCDTDFTMITGCYDLIVANIVHDVLREMAPDLFRLLASGGRLIVAGILRNEQEKSIINTYSGLGCCHLRTVFEDEWVAILFGKET
jgi:ribosomal protein L11 methyltransferase